MIDLEEGLHRYLVFMDQHPELKVEEPSFDAWCDEIIDQFKKIKVE